ncbi:hypothetical protein C7S16_5439 [Burkholderia thailandensis]|uniref:Uncharacterized protein n=1 Tax=Burkholderia thailandensis TaxID=57975 RepID=A0AAW9CNV8_BURTH|nr:hypothetical protein [Burkholderia thailandensis]MDW9250773.1 hypothetical protein [Burkholderia thailandensis]
MLRPGPRMGASSRIDVQCIGARSETARRSDAARSAAASRSLHGVARNYQRPACRSSCAETMPEQCAQTRDGAIDR